MGAASWWLFCSLALLTAFSPGPAVLLAVSNAASHGARRALLGSVGNALGVFLVSATAMLGLGALLKTSAWLFAALKLAGAAYLIWLGIQTWRAPDEPEAPTGAAPEASLAATFRGGFLVGISNPKLLIFAAAFFPQFITPDAPWLPQFAVLVATFVAVELAFYVVYALSGRRLAAHLVRGIWRRRLNRASGVIFAGFGVALLRYRP